MNTLLPLLLMLSLFAVSSCNETYRIIYGPLACDGEATPFASGAGSLIEPYIICSHDQLLRSYDHPGEYFELGSDIDYAGKTITPIATAASPYLAILDGKNFFLRNLTMTRGTDASDIRTTSPDRVPVALFHTIGVTGSIKNLNLENFVMSGNNFTSGLAYEIKGIAENITVQGTFTGRSAVSAFATIINQTSGVKKITVLDGSTVYSSGAGTLVWDGSTGESSYAAGVITLVFVSTVTELTNYADVEWNRTGPTDVSHIFTAGVVGYAHGSTLTKLKNYGDVISQDMVGGVVSILGYHSGASELLNFGNITGRDRVGGVVASSADAYEISKTYSSGNVAGRHYVGGVLGFNGNLKSAASKSIVTGTSNVGGLVGHSWSGPVFDSLFVGTLHALTMSADVVGGIAGGIGNGGWITYLLASRNVMMTPSLSTDNPGLSNHHLVYGYNNTGVPLTNTYYISYPALPGWGDTYSTAVIPASLSNAASYPYLNFTTDWSMGSSLTYFGSSSNHPVPKWMCAVDGVSCL